MLGIEGIKRLSWFRFINIGYGALLRWLLQY